MSAAFAEVLAAVSSIPVDYIACRIEADTSGRFQDSNATGRRLGTPGLVTVYFLITLPWDANNPNDHRPLSVRLSTILRDIEALPFERWAALLMEALARYAGTDLYTLSIKGMEDHEVSFITVTSTTTTTVPCGDGVRESYELNPDRCDDGNRNPGDGCDWECFVEFGWYCDEAGVPCTTICGDGLQGSPSETCDDGNNVSCDMCSSSCQHEPGLCKLQAESLCIGGFVQRDSFGECEFCHDFTCLPSECCELPKRAPPRPHCGDGQRAGAEKLIGGCDDGNIFSGDGCDSTCHVEPGWHCSEEGMLCSTICGDGIVGLPQEACDAGGDGDWVGCSSTACQLERGRCADQASTLCIGDYTPRVGEPRLTFCAAQLCTLEECCVPELEACLVHVGSNMIPVAACMHGQGPAATPAPAAESCSDYTCPAAWTKNNAGGITHCLEPLCRLATCCHARTVTCTCPEPQCCAEALLRPAFIDAGSNAGVRLTLLAPITLALEPLWRVQWYYYLGSGILSYSRIRSAMNESDSIVRKGYLLSIPSATDLEALFAAYPDLEIHSGAPITRPLHFWSSTPGAVGHHWAFRHRLGEQTSAYQGADKQSKHVLLQVVEAFTVVNGELRLRRMELEDGMPCCYTGDTSQLQDVPVELRGATFFAPEGLKQQHLAGGNYTVFAAVPATVFAVAVVDPYNKQGGRYKSGFDRLGWLEVPSPGFFLSPWALHLDCWRADLAAGETLTVPYQSGLFGSVAVSATSAAVLPQVKLGSKGDGSQAVLGTATA